MTQKKDTGRKEVFSNHWYYTIEAKIDGFGSIVPISAPFSEAIECFTDIGAKVMSSRDLVYEITQLVPPESYGGKMKKSKTQKGLIEIFYPPLSYLYGNVTGTYTREAVLYFKQERPLLILESLILDLNSARKATSAHKEGKEISISEEDYKKFQRHSEEDNRKEPEDREVLILPSRENFKISKNQNFEVARFLLKDQAESYFLWLDEKGIKETEFGLIYTDKVDSQVQPFLNQFKICLSLSKKLSEFLGNYPNLHWAGSTVRGILDEKVENIVNEKSSLFGKVINFLKKS